MRNINLNGKKIEGSLMVVSRFWLLKIPLFGPQVA